MYCFVLQAVWSLVWLAIKVACASGAAATVALLTVAVSLMVVGLLDVKGRSVHAHKLLGALKVHPMEDRPALSAALLETLFVAVLQLVPSRMLDSRAQATCIADTVTSMLSTGASKDRVGLDTCLRLFNLFQQVSSANRSRTPQL